MNAAFDGILFVRPRASDSTTEHSRIVMEWTEWANYPTRRTVEGPVAATDLPPYPLGKREGGEQRNWNINASWIVDEMHEIQPFSNHCTMISLALW